jgi:hypothetical protein
VRPAQPSSLSSISIARPLSRSIVDAELGRSAGRTTARRGKFPSLAKATMSALIEGACIRRR